MTTEPKTARCRECREPWPCSVRRNRGMYSGYENAKHSEEMVKRPPSTAEIKRQRKAQRLVEVRKAKSDARAVRKARKQRRREQQGSKPPVYLRRLPSGMLDAMGSTHRLTREEATEYRVKGKLINQVALEPARVVSREQAEALIKQWQEAWPELHGFWAGAKERAARCERIVEYAAEDAELALEMHKYARAQRAQGFQRLLVILIIIAEIALVGAIIWWLARG